jgi:hypothetical protein
MLGAQASSPAGYATSNRRCWQAGTPDALPALAFFLIRWFVLKGTRICGITLLARRR